MPGAVNDCCTFASSSLIFGTLTPGDTLSWNALQSARARVTHNNARPTMVVAWRIVISMAPRFRGIVGRNCGLMYAALDFVRCTEFKWTIQFVLRQFNSYLVRNSNG